VWDLASKKCIRTYDDHVSPVNSVAWHPDGTCVAAVGDDCTIKLWDIRCVVCCSMLDSKGTCMIVCVYGCVC